MKYPLLLWLLCVPWMAKAQFIDDFSDGDFTSNPAWQGDDTLFEVDAGNRLHLNAPAVSGDAYLSTQSEAINNAVWTFYVELGFDPSSSNYARVYLVSDRADLRQPLNGYYVMIGNTADEVSLYRQDGTTVTEIIDGRDGSVKQNLVTVRIRVTRDSLGNWTLENDTTGGTNYITEGSVFDATYNQTAWFGVRCVYTSTRSDKFYFDDFNVTGDPYVDTEPPAIASVTVTANNALDVLFTEPVEPGSAQAVSNYFVDNGIGAPVSATRDNADSALVHLLFGTTFQNGVTYLLTVADVSDLAGNTLTLAQRSFLYFIPDTPSKGDVIINEIFPDPTPPVGLPEAEFVEIFNRSQKFFDLTGWEIQDASASGIGTLPSYVLKPGEYLIICDESDTAMFSPFGSVVGTDLPSLNNSGDDVIIRSATGKVIDRVSYLDDWYRDDDKSDGGWTLERIDPLVDCPGAANWRASIDSSGGTPGRQNSVTGVFIDTIPPAIQKVTILDPLTIQVFFSEPVDSATGYSPSSYFIDNGIGNPVDVVLIDDEKIAVLTLGSLLQTRVVYTITVDGITDCFGNGIGLDNSLLFGLPEPIDSGDILINEVLFNPRSGGVDFVEIYNRTEKVLDLKGMLIREADAVSVDSISDEAVVSDASFLLLPHAYLVLTESPFTVKSQYYTPNPDGFLAVRGMPNYPDDEAWVILVKPGGQVVDRLRYSDAWHYALIDDKNGVSLERIRFDLPTQDPSNWHSAASTVGYATPAYRNSQSAEAFSVEDQVTINPKSFSPDQDGYNDFLEIAYRFSEPGYTANITIYDAAGRKIRDLVQNELLGIEGMYKWDGLDDDRQKAPIGIYIVYFEVFNLKGDVSRFKKVCVLAGKI